MKRFTAVLLMSLVLLVTFSSAALAKPSELPRPGITPDSPLYAFKGFFEGLQLFFTLDPADKAETATHLADVKISEVVAMSRDGKPDAAEKALKKYKKYVALAEKSIEKAAAKEAKKAREADVAQSGTVGGTPDGDDITPDVGSSPDAGSTGDAGTTTDVEATADAGSTGDVSRIEALRQHVAEMTGKHLAVLTALLDKVPDSARAAIQHAIEASSHGHENAPSHVGGGDGNVTNDATATEDASVDGTATTDAAAEHGKANKAKHQEKVKPHGSPGKGKANTSHKLPPTGTKNQSQRRGKAHLWKASASHGKSGDSHGKGH